MTNLKNRTVSEEFLVIHPLFDVPELKCDVAAVGPMKMSASVRTCLLLLRAYLVVMGMMLAYHVVDLAQHAAR